MDGAAPVSDDSNRASDNSAGRSLPEFPGEDFLAHAATQWMEKAEARFGSLLPVAQGKDPAAVLQIIDVELDDIPPLPAAHPQHERRLEYRKKVEAQNRANALKRYQLIMDARTTVYRMLKACTEDSAPVLSKMLKESCDLQKLQGIEGGYFDGPRAWAIILHRLGSAGTTQADQDFYRTAERLQRATQLPEGAPAADYSTKAVAFVTHIAPNLAQGYDSDGISQYLIDLMPRALREGGRRIKAELKAENTFHDHLYVIQKCRDLVREEQKAAPPTPAFITVSLEDGDRRRVAGTS